MKTLQSLLNKLNPFSSASKNVIIQCVNCWGYQEYSKSVSQKFRDKQIDIKNGMAKHSFIRAFVVRHIDGIRS